MIVTFYSYKGGVGRSMALVNVGEHLARQGVPVILVDWDLEAPGLERFFDGWQAEAESQEGVIDLLVEYRQAIARPPQSSRTETAARSGLPVPARELGRALGFASPRERLLDLSESLGLSAGALRFLPAGCRAGDQFTEYAAKVKAFDWAGFYRDWEGEIYLEWFRQELLAEDAVILVDSRTGVTEIGGVCVYQLADIVVMLCAANQNNLAGTVSMAEAFSRPIVRELRGGRPLRILPVPARISASEETEQTNLFIHDFAEHLGHHYRKLGLDLEEARRLLIPQIALYSFRERVAVREIGSSRFRRDDLTAAYREIAETLVALAPADDVLARSLRLDAVSSIAEAADEEGAEPKDQEKDVEVERRRADLALTRRLRAAFLAWESGQRSPRLLLHGPDLVQAQARLRDRPEDLLPEEARFIADSQKFQERRRQRAGRALAAAAMLVIAVLGLAVGLEWQQAQRRKEQALRLESWGLPRDLAARAGQLVALKLPNAVNRIDWLDGANSLRHLDLSGTNVAVLEGTPSSLVSLDLSGTPVTTLQALPTGLEELRLSYTRVRTLSGVPSGLRRLDLDETPLESLGGLPRNLLSLALDAEHIARISDLPGSLESLTLYKYQDPRLPFLPEGLRTLALVGTRIRSLAGLPLSLESLTLVNNLELAYERFPSSLNNLKIDLGRGTLELLTLPRALSALDLRRINVGYFRGVPHALRELTLVESSGADLELLPESLRSLSLGPREQSMAKRFPSTLEALALPWATGIKLVDLPRSLRSLDLSFSKIDNLEGLPENLETLILNGSSVSGLYGLPPRLRRLEIRWSNVRTLPKLPPTLSALDLSGCQDIKDLGGLPRSLDELNISDTGASTLDGLPPGLRSLDIRGTRIRSLRSGLPPHLEKLRLNPLQILEIGSLPRSLRELYFDEAPRRP